MPLLQINAGPDGPVWHQPDPQGVAPSPFPVTPDSLSEQLRVPGRGPAVVMLHGFKFRPGDRVACPHRHILSDAPDRRCWKALSWPRALRLAGPDATPEAGIGVAFGWDARGSIWAAHRRTEPAGHALARLIGWIARAAPGRPVHALAHSLGARVVLSALPHLPAAALDRIILLSPAEYRNPALTALQSPAGRAAEVISVTSRQNDLFDFLLERAIRPPVRGDRVMSTGLEDARNALTLQMDDPATLAALAGAGFPIAPPAGRVCHWSSYLRPGVFDLYSALLGARSEWPPPRLRQFLPAAPAPRWSRLVVLPEGRLPLPSARRAPL